MSYKTFVNGLANKTDTLYAITDSERAKLQMLLVDILRDVIYTCTKYNVNWTMIAGSALGAVRHTGFIPWDDDIDIAMPRTDYERFPELFMEEFGEKYIISKPNHPGEVKARFMKVLKKGTVLIEAGAEIYQNNMVFFDIFPLDYVPESSAKRQIKGKCCNLLMAIAGCVTAYKAKNSVSNDIMKGSMKGKVVWTFEKIIGFLFSWKTVGDWFGIIDMSIRYKTETELLTNAVGANHYFSREMQPFSQYFPVSKGLFENIEVNLPYNANAYLTKLYGDYMKIPPADKREKHFIIKLDLTN